MSWLSNIDGIFSYILFCFSSIFRLLVVAFNAFVSFLAVILAPLVYLTSYIVHALLIPINMLSNFETLYVFLGVAAFIGLLMGSLLHVVSNTLINVLNLRAAPSDSGRTAASVRAAQERKRLEGTWANTAELTSNKGKKSTPKAHTGYSDKDRANRKDGKGLLSQTILEEDDDSE